VSLHGKLAGSCRPQQDLRRCLPLPQAFLAQQPWAKPPEGRPSAKEIATVPTVKTNASNLTENHWLKPPLQRAEEI